jgi:hypothetical protein
VITDTPAFQILIEAMKGMKHVVIYLTTYSFHGHQKLQILVIDNVVDILLLAKLI